MQRRWLGSVEYDFTVNRLQRFPTHPLCAHKEPLGSSSSPALAHMIRPAAHQRILRKLSLHYWAMAQTASGPLWVRRRLFIACSVFGGGRSDPPRQASRGQRSSSTPLRNGRPHTILQGALRANPAFEDTHRAFPPFRDRKQSPPQGAVSYFCSSKTP